MSALGDIDCAGAVLVGFAELAVGEISQHDGVGRALELLLNFRGSHPRILAQSLAEFLSHLGIAGDHLHVEPKEMTHLVEGGLENLDGFHLGRIGEGFHELGVRGGLHGGAFEFALDDAQVLRNAQDAEMNLFHAFPVLAIHGVPFRPDHACLTNLFKPRSHPGARIGKVPRVHELR